MVTIATSERKINMPHWSGSFPKNENQFKSKPKLEHSNIH